MGSVLAISVTFGATSPKERGLDSPFAQKEKEKSVSYTHLTLPTNSRG